MACPGRLLDLQNQGYVDLSNVEVFILDEADRMLDMGPYCFCIGGRVELQLLFVASLCVLACVLWVLPPGCQ